jgi:hypothetical protein
VTRRELAPRANAPAIFGVATVFMSARKLGHSVAVAEGHCLGAHRGIAAEAKSLEAAMQIGDPLLALLAGRATISSRLERRACPSASAMTTRPKQASSFLVAMARPQRVATGFDGNHFHHDHRAPCAHLSPGIETSPDHRVPAIRRARAQHGSRAALAGERRERTLDAGEHGAIIWVAVEPTCRRAYTESCNDRLRADGAMHAWWARLRTSTSISRICSTSWMARSRKTARSSSAGQRTGLFGL